MPMDEKKHILSTGELRNIQAPQEGYEMAAYIIQMHENLLQTFIPVKYMDVEIAYVGDGEGTDVYVGAVGNQENGIDICFMSVQAQKGLVTVMLFLTWV